MHEATVADELNLAGLEPTAANARPMGPFGARVGNLQITQWTARGKK